MAHRVIFEELTGRTLRANEQLDHLCRQTLCVNPDHLEPVTGLINMQRRYAHYAHCSNGHAYTPDNTYRRPDGHRDCRSCIRERVRRYKAKRSAA